ncbi:exosortase family protein XrtG [Anaerosporobacter sp.]|uniref:exosortase family protein XrtG n=1 Tax=Anaerosporobacter sp. TaxID=1872529 RepID=UPI00286ED9B1|nr:exosortase family protein XrtG [Anaerosporobacter sp.]
MDWLKLASFLIWLYILSVLRRGKLNFWYFMIGSVGMFVFSMVYIQPILTIPLTKAVTMVSGSIGKGLQMFEGYPEYAILFIKNTNGAISLIVDYECAGIIEMAAFFSLLVFFAVYTPVEKILVGISGGFYLFFANVLRLVVIGVIVAIFGNRAYYLAHTIVGRLIFYGLSMLLYYVVFTKAQIIRQKVGSFGYDNE